MNPQADPQRIENALRYIPADDRETWLRIGMAIKSELDESGFDIWDRWSKESENYNSRDALKTWKSFRKNGITIGTLFHEAMQRGYQHERSAQPISQDEIERRRQESQAKAAAEQVRLEQAQQDAATQAAEIWKHCGPAESHPYLTAREVKAHGIRLYSGALAINGMSCTGSVVIPIRNAAGALHSLQFIWPDGEKLFLPAGRVKGCYYGIGKPNGTVCIVEGYATAASVHEATGHAVAVAFNAGNLVAVARALRDKLPEVRILICADNDIKAEA